MIEKKRKQRYANQYLYGTEIVNICIHVESKHAKLHLALESIQIVYASQIVAKFHLVLVNAVHF